MAFLIPIFGRVELTAWLLDFPKELYPRELLFFWGGSCLACLFGSGVVVWLLLRRK